MISVNNKLVLESYKGDKKIKAEVSSGFAKISQKSSLIGLKLLAPAVIFMGGEKMEFKKGQIAYFEEETLFAGNWSKKLLDCDAFEEKFILADFANVRFVK